MYAEAAEQYREVLEPQLWCNTKAKIGLAEAYYYLQKYSAAIVIYEELQTPVAARFHGVIHPLSDITCPQRTGRKYTSVLLHWTWFQDEEIDVKLRMPGASV